MYYKLETKALKDVIVVLRSVVLQFSYLYLQLFLGTMPYHVSYSG